MTRRRSISLTAVATTWLALLTWVLLSHPSSSARLGTAAALALAGATFLLVGLAGRVGRWPSVLLGVTAIAALLLTEAGNAWFGGPLTPPLRYDNTVAMVLVVLAAGVVLAGSVAQPPWPRPLAPTLIALSLVATYLMQAKAALLACAFLLAWYAVHRAGRAASWIVLAVAGTALSWAATAWWAARPDRVPGVVTSALSETRIDLWHDALLITRDHLMGGAGPGRFTRLSPAAQDPDLSWTHSTPLQLSSELGLVGLGLFGLLVLALLVTAGRWSPVLAVVLLPTTIDYVLDFPSIIVLVSAVAGAAWALAGNPTLTPPAP